MAKAHAGCPVFFQNFLELDLPDNEFDGVFANASMLPMEQGVPVTQDPTAHKFVFCDFANPISIPNSIVLNNRNWQYSLVKREI